MHPSSAPLRDTPSGDETAESPVQGASPSMEGRDFLTAVAAAGPYLLLTKVGRMRKHSFGHLEADHFIVTSQEPSEILSALAARAETLLEESLQREAQDELDDFEQEALQRATGALLRSFDRLIHTVQGSADRYEALADRLEKEN